MENQLKNVTRAFVTGATGAQGGAVARALLRRGVPVRGLTRNPESESARALASQGAEVVKGDLADAAALGPAIAGCDVVFGVTNFWEHFAAETAHGKNLIDACKRAGVKHVVLSTLPSVKRLAGDLDVPHFELKAVIEQHARDVGLPATFVHLAFYYDNFTSWFAPKRGEDGVLAFGFPQGDAPLGGLGVEDLGAVVVRLFADGPQNGRVVRVVGDAMPANGYAAVMSKVLGEPVVYRNIPRDVFASFGFPGAADLAHMFDFYRRCLTEEARHVAETNRLAPGTQSFETWLDAHAEQFRTAVKAANAAQASR